MMAAQDYLRGKLLGNWGVGRSRKITQKVTPMTMEMQPRTIPAVANPRPP
jgi:hypothetical protein